eukprot:gnl/TRDRNA2_/TRDRNA2_172803_c2_seq2.p1 gnl/TRDRNA2_/TRDRNA2_172803_c2~~gnl/TRDRNA2_/TRDRNA2_172803_c2_seq2.p1  ORF type:complete len:446 (-),score=22.08 gnl/TRDRNA2_/TRDRNA2_172803_c2_seq2:71-1336(-)
MCADQCSVTDGSAASAEYPCACGTANCTSGQFCTSESSKCEDYVAGPVPCNDPLCAMFCLTSSPNPSDDDHVVGAGHRCTFPFRFKRKTYNACATASSGGPWCPVRYPGKPHAWGNCGSACQVSDLRTCRTAVSAGYGAEAAEQASQECKFPFTWKGVWYNKCAVEDWHLPWCETARSWGVCDTATCEVMELDSVGSTDLASRACFPGNAKVISRSGPRDLAEVHIGDELLGFNPVTKKPEFTRIHAWLHREPHQESIFISLHTSTAGIVMSPGHNVAVGSPDNYIFARDALIGNILFTPNGTATVTSTSQVQGRGIYAPWTRTSNLYVGTGEHFFLAHGLANVPSRFEHLLHPLFSILTSALPFVHDFDEHSESNYVHPVVSCFWSIVGVLHHDSFAFDRIHPLGLLVASLVGAIEGDVV